MARVSQQGASALTVWLIVFVFFWLVSTVWLVVLYTNQAELKGQAERYQREIHRLATNQEMSSIELLKNLPEGGTTAVGALEAARGETARLSTGEPKDTVPVVLTKRNAILSTIKTEAIVPNPDSFEDAALLPALTMLYESFQNEHKLRVAAETRSAELDADVAKQVQLVADMKADFAQRLQDVMDQFNSGEADRTAFRTQKDEAVSQLVKDADERRTLWDADLTRERQRHNECKGQLVEMQKRVTAIQAQCGDMRIGPDSMATATRPDGQILTAFPGDDIVYINLGEGDRLVAGLKFAVYAAGSSIPSDGRAKAQIEVASISANSAECEIVWVANGEVILQGDLIASPVYDRDRPPSFLVLGEFDLLRDGVPDADGRQIIEANITKWGGTITSEVSAITDFVVLGMPPPKPREPANATPEQKARYDRDFRIWERYEELRSAAQNLAIPILTQEVFLNFLGQRPSRVVPR